jgi:hypothetical protein
VCEKWKTLTTLRLNSLFAPKNSLLGLQKFPVPLRREFRWKSLNSLASLDAKIAAESLSLQNSLLNSLLTGNLGRETGSIGAATTTTHSGSYGDFL